MRYYLLWTDPATEAQGWTGPHPTAQAAWTAAPAVPTRDCVLTEESDHDRPEAFVPGRQPPGGVIR